MAGLTKEVKLRAIEEELPMEILSSLVPTRIPPDEIGRLAHEALLGRTQEEDEETDEGEGKGSLGSVGGINRFIFVGLDSSNAFIDPAGTLLHVVRKVLRQLRRARGADPAGHRVRPKTAQQKKVQNIPTTTG